MSSMQYGYPEKVLGDLPPYPTDAMPGSEEKINVLKERARRGWNLHHPLDKKLPNCNETSTIWEDICRL